MIKKLIFKTINYLLEVMKPLLKDEIKEIRLAIGQSAILASRANSEKFKFIWDAEVKVFSQWGEDGILDYLCERLEISKPRIMEIGAGNFSECNSRFLAENRNASVYAIDTRNDLLVASSALSLKWKTHIFLRREFVTPTNINEIFIDANKEMGGVDIVSIDIDGNDYWVLKSLEMYNVSIVVVEYNPLFGHTKSVTIPREDVFERRVRHHSCLYYGASIRAYVKLMENKGFDFLGTNRVGNNAFFVKSHLKKHIPFNPSSDLFVYTDWRIRESRTTEGILDYMSGTNRIKLIKDLPLVDLETLRVISVHDANTF